MDPPKKVPGAGGRDTPPSRMAVLIASVSLLIARGVRYATYKDFIAMATTTPGPVDQSLINKANEALVSRSAVIDAKVGAELVGLSLYFVVVSILLGPVTIPVVGQSVPVEQLVKHAWLVVGLILRVVPFGFYMAAVWFGLYALLCEDPRPDPPAFEVVEVQGIVQARRTRASNAPTVTATKYQNNQTLIDNKTRALLKMHYCLSLAMVSSPFVIIGIWILRISLGFDV